jgi:hypothetical protein
MSQLIKQLEAELKELRITRQSKEEQYIHRLRALIEAERHAIESLDKSINELDQPKPEPEPEPLEQLKQAIKQPVGDITIKMTDDEETLDQTINVLFPSKQTTQQIKRPKKSPKS